LHCAGGPRPALLDRTARHRPRHRLGQVDRQGLFSENANASPQIEREVERAVNKGIPIIPLRIENVQPSEALEYFLSSPHWLDAFKPPMGQHLDRLAEAVQALVGSNLPATEVAEAVAVSAAPPAEPVKMPARANPKKSRPRTRHRERYSRASREPSAT